MEASQEMDHQAKLETIARVCHDANRAWCLAHGDTSQVEWDDAEDWQKESALVGVQNALNGNTPEESHESWLAHKAADGWTYGPVKDPEKKTHPAFRPYSELDAMTKAKDDLFVSIVRALAPTLNLVAVDPVV